MVMALAGCANNTLPGGEQAAAPAAPPSTTTIAPTVGPMAALPAGPKIPGATATVGLLVPLSGPNAALGQALTQEAEMALFESGDQTTALVVHDTEAPAGAGAAAQMAIDQGANILLGPVFAAHAKIVGPIAAPARDALSWASCRDCRSNAKWAMPQARASSASQHYCPTRLMDIPWPRHWAPPPRVTTQNKPRSNTTSPMPSSSPRWCRSLPPTDPLT